METNGKIPLETSGADIEGKTSTEHVLAKACDWIQPGSSGVVFPNTDPLAIETPGMLNTLFK